MRIEVRQQTVRRPSVAASGPAITTTTTHTHASGSDAHTNMDTSPRSRSRSRSGSGSGSGGNGSGSSAIRSAVRPSAVLIQVQECDTHTDMQGQHNRMHASGTNKHSRTRRQWIQSVATWSTRHTGRLHGGLLLALFTLLLFHFTLLHWADPTATASSFASVVASFDVQLRRHLQAAFVRVPPQWHGISWRPLLPLSLTTLANPKAYTHSNVPRSQWPPVLACGPFQPEIDMWSTLAPCLLGTYFAAQKAAMPNLLHFFSVQPTTIDCDTGRYVDVDPAAQTTEAKPEQLSPGMMLQSYLSFMSLSVASSTFILHSSPHPWWRWRRQEKRSDWKWQFRQVDEDDNTTLPIQRDTHVDVFDLGDFLQFNQWEVSRSLWEACPSNSNVRTRIVQRHTPLGSASLTSASRPQLEQDMQALWNELRAPMEGQTSDTTAVPFQLAPTGDAQTPLPVHGDSVGALTLLLSSYSLRHVFNPQVLQVIEIRLWLRHTVQQMIHNSVVASHLPTLRPATRDQRRADTDNHFLSPAMLRATADIAMRAGHTAAHIQHGFTRNSNPGPAANPRTWNRQREGPVEYDIKSEKDDDSVRAYNSFAAVFDTYYDNRLHVAIVIKQAARMRKVRLHVPTDADDEDPWPTAAASFSTSTRSAAQLADLAVPVEYLSSVVSPAAVLAFVKRWRGALPQSLRDAMRLTLYFDCIGCDSHADAESLRVALVQLGLEPRVQFNLPLATQIQLVALSDVQMYFCVEEEDPAAPTSAALDVGSCAMPAYLRSEPLKLLFAHPRLSDVYPHVRNVLLMEIVRDSSPQSSPQQLAQRAHTMHVRLPDDDHQQDEGDKAASGEATTVRSDAQRLQHHFPALPHSPLPMVPLAVLESAQQQIIRFVSSTAAPPPSASPSPSSPSSSSSPSSASDARALGVFTVEVERVWKRKLQRLRDGGVPAFLDNYDDHFPAHKIITPYT